MVGSFFVGGKNDRKSKKSNDLKVNYDLISLKPK